MDIDNFQDEPFVNILSTSPPAPTITNDDNNNSSSRAMGRSAGGALLRSRRNPPPIVLSTSPSSSSPALDLHGPISQPSHPSVGIVPSLPVEIDAQDGLLQSASAASITTTSAPVISSAPTCSSALMCGKGKNAPTAKELEAQCSKPQDVGQAVDISDFECSLCFRVFYQPVTTTCGHVFCKQCLFSSLKYSCQCPLCRHKLDNSPVPHKYAINVVLMNMIEKYFPTEYKERVEEDVHYQEAHAANEKQITPQGTHANRFLTHLTLL